MQAFYQLSSVHPQTQIGEFLKACSFLPSGFGTGHSPGQNTLISTFLLADSVSQVLAEIPPLPRTSLDLGWVSCWLLRRAAIHSAMCRSPSSCQVGLQGVGAREK